MILKLTIPEETETMVLNALLTSPFPSIDRRDFSL